jgi:fibronectin type 3 domain-containing protein
VVVVQHSATLTWAPGDATTVSYNVYRSTVSGSSYAKMSAAQAPQAYTDSSVQAGSTYFYVITALNAAGEESTYSNQVTAAVP